MPVYRVNQGSWNYGGITYGFGDHYEGDEKEMRDFIAAGVLVLKDDPLPAPRVGDPYADLNDALRGPDVIVLTSFIDAPPDRVALTSLLRASRIARRSAVLQQAIRALIAMHDHLTESKGEPVPSKATDPFEL